MSLWRGHFTALSLTLLVSTFRRTEINHEQGRHDRVLLPDLVVKHTLSVRQPLDTIRDGCDPRHLRRGRSKTCIRTASTFLSVSSVRWRDLKLTHRLHSPLHRLLENETLARVNDINYRTRPDRLKIFEENSCVSTVS